jgi:hypothetical protein
VARKTKTVSTLWLLVPMLGAVPKNMEIENRRSDWVLNLLQKLTETQRMMVLMTMESMERS